MDLDFVLSVISHGPTKTFAFRRLKYLLSKFTMYTLLNESQELVDMKVRLRTLEFYQISDFNPPSAQSSQVCLAGCSQNPAETWFQGFL